MKKIMFGVYLILVWALSLYEGNSGFAVLMSLVPIGFMLEIGFAILKWQVHKRKAVRR